jgi:carboxyl-terminal processing protease
MADNKIELMKMRSTFKTLCILSVLSASLSCKAVPATLPGDLQPDEQQSIVCKTVAEMITNYNYKKVPLNDSLSAIVYNRYIKALDENHNYFLASDIKSFEGLKYTLDNDIIDGNLNNVFLIFNTYKKRYKERVQYSLTQVAKSFDFKKKDEFIYDREKLPWITSSTAMNELWTKRVKYDLLNLKLASPDTAKNKETLRKRYENLARQLDKLNSQDVFQTFMDALTNAIDPHTNYFNPSNAAQFNIQMSRSVVGIGASLLTENEYVTIKTVVPGGPADKSHQINIDDRIIGVAQGNGEFQDIVGWRQDNAITLIRGEKGTKVRLKLLPKGKSASDKPKIVEMIREKIILQDQSAKKEIKTYQENGKTYKIGIINVPAFYLDFDAYNAHDPNYKSTTRDVKLLLDTLKQMNVDGVVMDLRQNGGGSLVEAINLTGLFIKTGPVVQVRDTRNRIEVDKDEDPGIAWNGPLAVLVDRFSASASEIFSAAIQDYGRGLILGTQTYGKGTVQSVYNLNNVINSSIKERILSTFKGNTQKKGDEFGQLNLTVAKFYRISGGSTQHKGVSPDISFPALISLDKYGEDTEPSALPYDMVKQTAYTKLGDIQTVLPELRKMHDQRMSKNAGYKYLLEDIADYQKMEKEKSVSLNETQLKQQRDSDEAKLLERNNLRRAAMGLRTLKKGEVRPKGEDLDFLKVEAGQILLDYNTLSDQPLAKVVVNP